MLEVLDPTDTRLRTNSEPISPSELKTKSVQLLIEEMLDLVYGQSNKGAGRDTNKPTTVGLSANQVGINKRISIVDLAIALKGYNDLHVLINPEVIWRSRSTIERREGCVNLPDTFGFISRSNRVIVEALDRSGNHLRLDLKGWAATLLQHEIDHLEGHLFIDRLSDPTHAHLVEKGDYQSYKKAKKDWTKFRDVSGLVLRVSP